MLVPSIQRKRPTDTMSVHIGMKGAACLVEAQSVSSSSQVGRLRAKCLISACMSGRVYGGVLVDQIDGDADVRYRRHTADWLRVLPLDDDDEAACAVCESYLITITPAPGA